MEYQILYIRLICLSNNFLKRRINFAKANSQSKFLSGNCAGIFLCLQVILLKLFSVAIFLIHIVYVLITATRKID